MATSTPANANSLANIIPVGPPPAITTACSVIATLRPASTTHAFRASHLASAGDYAARPRVRLDADASTGDVSRVDAAVIVAQAEAIESTLFRFAQYFGWLEVVRRYARNPDPRHVEDTQRIGRAQGQRLTDIRVGLQVLAGEAESSSG
jgi:hypothetical protein